MRRALVFAALTGMFALGSATPARAGDWLPWTSHGIKPLWDEGGPAGANDGVITPEPQGGGAGSGAPTAPAATVFSQPPACLPLGVNSGRCSVVLSGRSDPFVTLDVPLENGSTEPASRFLAIDLPLSLSVIGTSGPDRLSVRRGQPSQISGGDGDDVIDSRNGHVDDVRCGAGTDTVTADAVDGLSECEVVRLR